MRTFIRKYQLINESLFLHSDRSPVFPSPIVTMAMPEGIDPHIMEIMAKLNQGNMDTETAPQLGEEVKPVEEPKPPKTYEEFLKAENMVRYETDCYSDVVDFFICCVF